MSDDLKETLANPVEILDDAGWSLSLCFGRGDKARDAMHAFSDAYRAKQLCVVPSVEALTDKQLSEIGQQIADKSPWGKRTAKYARIYQAAVLGAREASNLLTGEA